MCTTLQRQRRNQNKPNSTRKAIGAIRAIVGIHKRQTYSNGNLSSEYLCS